MSDVPCGHCGKPVCSVCGTCHPPIGGGQPLLLPNNDKEAQRRVVMAHAMDIARKRYPRSVSESDLAALLEKGVDLPANTGDPERGPSYRLHRDLVN